MSHPDPVPPIEQATTYTAVIGATPVVIVLPRVRSVHIAPSGALVTADAWTTAITAHGAQPLRDMEFAGGPVDGWLITLADDMTTVTLEGPAGLGEIYTGGLVAEPKWRQLVERLHDAAAGLPVITGTVDRLEPEAALDIIEAERAVWVRARTVFT